MNHPKPAENTERDAELDKLRHEIEILTRGGIIEVAVRNPSVAEYMSHWESRATAAEGRVALLEEERSAADLALVAWVNVAEMLADQPGMEAHFHDVADATLDMVEAARARLSKGGQS